MSDRELVVDFLTNLVAGMHDTEVPIPLCYLPKRKKSNHSTDTLFSEQTPGHELRMIFNHTIPKFPEGWSRVKPNVSDFSTTFEIPENWFNKMLSNVLLYKGYLEPKLSEHLIYYLEGKDQLLKILWKEFCPTARDWRDPFTFQLPLNLDELTSVYDSENVWDFRAKTFTRKKKSRIPTYVLYETEGAALANSIGFVTKANSAYYLLLRDVYSRSSET
jgi:hypothetical protein